MIQLRKSAGFNIEVRRPRRGHLGRPAVHDLDVEHAPVEESRRFYSTIFLAEANSADLRLSGSRWYRHPTLSAICPCVPGSRAIQLTDGHGQGNWERSADRSSRLPGH